MMTDRTIDLLDVGSGRNPFLFSLPEAITLDLPSSNKSRPIAGMLANPVEQTDPHIEADATFELPFGNNSIKNIMMHHVVGYAKFGVINPDGLAKLASEAYRILLPNGSLYIKSSFSLYQSHEWSLDTREFTLPLLAAGFDLKDLDFLYIDCLEEYPLAMRIIEEAAHLSGIEPRETNCCFIVATKPEV